MIHSIPFKTTPTKQTILGKLRALEIEPPGPEYICSATLSGASPKDALAALVALPAALAEISEHVPSSFVFNVRQETLPNSKGTSLQFSLIDKPNPAMNRSIAGQSMPPAL